jgi:hypothetical protein
MGVIYYKNKQYASGGSTPSSSSEHIELTYAEYQALSEAEQKNGAVYFITDVDNDGDITGYTGGTGITVGEDKVIAIKDIKKNYVDNSNFRINTRGQSEYTTSDSSIYTVDRWYIDGGVLTPVDNGVQFTNTNTSAGSSSLIRLKQDIPYTFVDLAGKTLTLSAKINGTIYTGKATIPTEKPTEGTAIQYIAVGIPAFGINLNYSITGDYFVPYLALAYSQSVLVEWMKLEVNDEFSGYIEPDYMTELIKMNMTTSDKGALNLPYTKAEVDAKIDDTQIGTKTTWSSEKIVEETLSIIEYSDYEKLSVVPYGPSPDSLFIGYKMPSTFTQQSGNTHEIIITDKRGYVRHKGVITVGENSTLSVNWENENVPTMLSLLSTTASQVYYWKMLFKITAVVPINFAVIGDYTQTTAVTGYKAGMNYLDIISVIDVTSNYDVYAKQIS